MAFGNEHTHILSTEKMVRFAQESPKERFLIATETGIIHRLQKEAPGKRFEPVNADAVCKYMKMITLTKLRDSLRDEQYESPSTRRSPFAPREPFNEWSRSADGDRRAREVRAPGSASCTMRVTGNTSVGDTPDVPASPGCPKRLWPLRRRLFVKARVGGAAGAAAPIAPPLPDPPTDRCSRRRRSARRCLAAAGCATPRWCT